MRHAKSSWADEGIDDFDRPLNERGIAAAERVGREIRDRRIDFDHILASPAVRVRQTLDQVGRGYGQPFQARFDPGLYRADSLSWLNAVEGFAESVRAPLLVGHNPALHHLVLELAEEDAEGCRRQIRDNFPTAALTIVTLDVDSWKDAVPGCGEIAELILPRELD